MTNCFWFNVKLM